MSDFNKLDNEYILLTGGAGYIGSAISYYLLNDNKNIIIVDNLSKSNNVNLEKLPNKDNLIFFNVDCCDYNQMNNIFEQYKISTIIHLAGYKAVSESIEYPIIYYENNIVSSINILKLASMYKVKKFIFSSSCTVYGAQLSPLVEETRTGFGITNPYGMSKYIIETMIKDFALINISIQIIILRYFNPVGSVNNGQIIENPKDIPNNLIPVVLRNYINKTPILIFGKDYNTIDGTPARDYIHIEDLALGHIKAIDYDNKDNNLSIFNLGTGKSYTVLEVLKTFEKVNNISLNYKFVDRRPGDLENVYCDPQKSYNLLGWKANRDLEEMCDFTYLI